MSSREKSESREPYLPVELVPDGRNLAEHGNLTDEAVARDTVKTFWARLELKKQGIDVPSKHKRSPRLRRVAPRPSAARPLGPGDFIERLIAELGSHSAKVLVMDALAIVEATGDAAAWMLQAGLARELGLVSAPVANFLIWEFAEAATMRLSFTNPVLSSICTRIERYKREHGHEHDDQWPELEGAPEWEALRFEWEDAQRELFMAIMVRNGGFEILEAEYNGEGNYAQGRISIFGV